MANMDDERGMPAQPDGDSPAYGNDESIRGIGDSEEDTDDIEFEEESDDEEEDEGSV